MPWLRLPNGQVAHVKLSGIRMKSWCQCGEAASLQCDWKLGRKTRCDAAICAKHGKEVGPNKHLCPEHQAAYENWLRQRQQMALVLEGSSDQVTPWP